MDIGDPRTRLLRQAFEDFMHHFCRSTLEDVSLHACAQKKPQQVWQEPVAAECGASPTPTC